MKRRIAFFIEVCFFAALIVSTFFTPPIEPVKAAGPKYPMMLAYCSMAQQDHEMIGQSMPELLLETCE